MGNTSNQPPNDPASPWGETWVPLRFTPIPQSPPEPSEAATTVPWAGRRGAGGGAPQRHRVIVAYDVASDRTGQRRYRRLKILLESMGRRVQRSVFEMDLSEGELQRLLQRVRGILHPQFDDFRTYPRCTRCVSLSTILFPKSGDQPRARRTWIA